MSFTESGYISSAHMSAESCSENVSGMTELLKGWINRMKKFEIYKHIGKVSYINNGYTKELNYISWDDREPVYDIRSWNENHTKYGKGVTLTAGEMILLQNLIKDRPFLGERNENFSMGEYEAKEN